MFLYKTTEAHTSSLRSAYTAKFAGAIACDTTEVKHLFFYDNRKYVRLIEALAKAISDQRKRETQTENQHVGYYA